MGWLNVTAAADKVSLDELETWFWERGAVSVTVEDGGEDPIYEPKPAETPMWGKVLVTGLFEDDASLQHLGEGLEAAGFEIVALDELDDRPWEREWLNRFKPMRFGDRLWICPTGHELDPIGRVVISLDPGLAFGTGTHETTRLCLEYIDGAELTGRTVIDYGCGSGILGIGAALVGANEIYGVDTDPQAITASRMNADRNGVNMALGLVGELSLDEADLVLANILAQPLVELAVDLSGLVAPGGALVLSGIMESQAEWVRGAYQDKLTFVDETVLNGWVRLIYHKPSA